MNDNLFVERIDLEQFNLSNLIALFKKEFPDCAFFATRNQDNFHIYCFAGLIASETDVDNIKNFQSSYALANPITEYPYLVGLLGILNYQHDEQLPTVILSVYRYSFVISVKSKTLILTDRLGARRKIEVLKEKIRQHHLQIYQKSLSCAEFTVDCSDEQFKKRIKKAKEHIVDGDIFQVVLSRMFTAQYEGDPLELFCDLLEHEVMPYYFYVSQGDSIFISASPEKCLSNTNGLLEVCPLAGTRRLHADHSYAEVAAELYADEKEVSEHMMLVDLARNDLGRVAEKNSVVVKELKKAKAFNSIMHLSSTVQGKISADSHAFAALQASFPAGTLSGAPKTRAMQIIAELETTPRRLYGGAVFVVNQNDDLDSCIAIRMAEFRSHTVHVRTGAGIVIDSNPSAEVEETVNKARMMINRLRANQPCMY